VRGDSGGRWAQTQWASTCGGGRGGGKDGSGASWGGGQQGPVALASAKWDSAELAH